MNESFHIIFYFFHFLYMIVINFNLKDEKLKKNQKEEKPENEEAMQEEDINFKGKF